MCQTRMHPLQAVGCELRPLKINCSNSFNGRAGTAGSVMVTMLADTTEYLFCVSPFADINKGLNADWSARQASSTQHRIMMGAIGALPPHGLCASARDAR